MWLVDWDQFVVNVDGDGDGQPCGASHISKNFECHMGGARGSRQKVDEQVERVNAMIATIDLKAVASDPARLERMQLAGRMEDAGDIDSAAALDNESLSAFVPNEHQKKLRDVILTSDMPDYLLEYASTAVGLSTLKARVKDANAYLDVVDQFGVDDLEQITKEEIDSKVLSGTLAIKVPGAKGVMEGFSSYEADVLPDIFDALDDGVADGWGKSAYLELAASAKDDGDDSLAEAYSRLAEDSKLRRNFAKYREFDVDNIEAGDGEYWNRSSAESDLYAATVASNPALRKAVRRVEGENSERVWEWLAGEIYKVTDDIASRQDSLWSGFKIAAINLDAKKAGTVCGRGWVGMKKPEGKGCKRAKAGAAEKQMRVKRKRLGKSPEKPKAKVKQKSFKDFTEADWDKVDITKITDAKMEQISRMKDKQKRYEAAYGLYMDFLKHGGERWRRRTSKQRQKIRKFADRMLKLAGSDAPKNYDFAPPAPKPRGELYRSAAGHMVSIDEADGDAT